jgi:hypothetical protein
MGMNRRSNTDSVDGRPYLTLQEFSELNHIPMATLRRWAAKGILPHRQPAGKNGRIFVTPDALERCREGQDAQPRPKVEDASSMDTGRETDPPRLPGRQSAWMKTMDQLQQA